MKYIDEYRDSSLVHKLTDKLHKICKNYSKEIVLMEVCGTHTMSIFRSGIRKLLPKNIRLLSGPGCPVCVTSNYYMDKSIAYARKDDVIITTFGDMLKVPGSTSSLQKERANGRKIVVLYSALDALQIARENPNYKIIFLGVGFETTTPTLACTIKIAKENKINNFFVYSGHKLIPPALRALIATKELNLDGFILPGHVSTIIGKTPYEFIANEFNIPCVITGFEPVDIAQGILMMAEQIIGKNSPKVEIQYNRCVQENGNPKAQSTIREVFKPTDSFWRGVGNIPKSGLKINKDFSNIDSESNIEVEVEKTKDHKGCICGEILKGIKTPLNCKLFRKTCMPLNPIGACMVSSEGTCAAYYRYEPC